MLGPDRATSAISLPPCAYLRASILRVEIAANPANLMENLALAENHYAHLRDSFWHHTLAELERIAATIAAIRNALGAAVHALEHGFA